MSDLTKNPDLRERDKPDDFFGDWKWREGLAELMVPIIGRLYRNGVNVLMYGHSLTNQSPIDIMKAHRFIRRVEDTEISELETYPFLQRIELQNISDCEIDLGEIVVDFMKANKSLDESNIDEHIKLLILDPLQKVEQSRPNTPQDIVLYGFGRIGRLVTRIMAQMTGAGNYYRLKGIVVRKGSDTNDLLKRASLLRRDSVHGSFHGTIRVDNETNTLVINGNPVQIIYANSPDEFKYADYGIENPIVIDNTGVWKDEKALSNHLHTGASKVVLTAPGKGEIKNIVNGINNSILNDSDKIISAASCTTNAIVPVLDIINKKYSIKGGHIETVHAYTNDQNLIDNYHKKDRRGRSAALNMVITSTGAVKAVSKALPELTGKLTGNAIRVPTPNVSLAVMSLTVEKNNLKKDDVNEFLRLTAFNSKYREIVGFVNSTEIVSSDFYSSPFASVIDSQATIVSDDKITLYCWYDNEYGYSVQVVDLVKNIAGINLLRLPVND
tara:strand:+ start:19386 stop:20879 length:1494 start_codon:yes stop_codon:yes gene_type:complete